MQSQIIPNIEPKYIFFTQFSPLSFSSFPVLYSFRPVGRFKFINQKIRHSVPSLNTLENNRISYREDKLLRSVNSIKRLAQREIIGFLSILDFCPRNSRTRSIKKPSFEKSRVAIRSGRIFRRKSTRSISNRRRWRNRK